MDINEIRGGVQERRRGEEKQEFKSSVSVLKKSVVGPANQSVLLQVSHIILFWSITIIFNTINRLCCFKLLNIYRNFRSNPSNKVDSECCLYNQTTHGKESSGPILVVKTGRLVLISYANGNLGKREAISYKRGKFRWQDSENCVLLKDGSD